MARSAASSEKAENLNEKWEGWRGPKSSKSLKKGAPRKHVARGVSIQKHSQKKGKVRYVLGIRTNRKKKKKVDLRRGAYYLQGTIRKDR